mmetsp:Transcript_165887/g.318564  ORF Transcript_165887/g.318564 Transcript_165887/m.318564 type:complete len:412 (+) Transcript_165887:110-1345(+)
MAPKKKGSGKGKGEKGYKTEKLPEAKKKDEDDDSEDGSDEEDTSSEEEEAGGEAAASAPRDDLPKFKNKEELRQWEAELKEQALADKKTMDRLEEVRQRREKARLEREAAEKAEAEAEAKKKAEDEEKEKKRQEALSERPVLDVPGPKDIKSACMKLQDVAGDEFLAKHGIKGATGNKLAKMKHGDFKNISQDFHDNADTSQLHTYKDPALGAFADRRALFDSGAQAQRLEAVYDIDWSQLPAASSAKQKQNQAAPKMEFAEEKKASPQQEPAAENTFKEATPNKELTEEKVASQEQEPTAEDLQRKELEKAQNLAKNALEEAERQLRECELRQPREKPSSQHSSMNKVAAGSSSDTAKEAEDQVKSEWEQEQNEYIKIEKEYWYDCEEEMVVVPQVLLRKTSKSSGCRQM